MPYVRFRSRSLGSQAHQAGPHEPLETALIHVGGFVLASPLAQRYSYPSGKRSIDRRFLPSAFEEDRRELVRLINEFARSSEEVDQASHPLFGKIPVSQWLRWGYLHSDHHLRQFGV